jgi:hypothetical protein
MITMGRYQLEAVQVQSSKALEETRLQVSKSLKEVHADVKEMREMLDAIQIGPVATASK